MILQYVKVICKIDFGSIMKVTMVTHGAKPPGFGSMSYSARNCSPQRKNRYIRELSRRVKATDCTIFPRYPVSRGKVSFSCQEFVGHGIAGICTRGAADTELRDKKITVRE